MYTCPCLLATPAAKQTAQQSTAIELLATDFFTVTTHFSSKCGNMFLHKGLGPSKIYQKTTAIVQEV